MLVLVEPPLALVLATFLVATLGSVLPVSPVEPWLLAVSIEWPARVAVPVAVIAAAGHMIGKSLLFTLARRAPGALTPRRQAAVERVREKLVARPSLQFALLLLSAVTGLPPFYALTLAAGVLNVEFRIFLVAGLLGRAVRFVSVVMLPELFGFR